MTSTGGKRGARTAGAQARRGPKRALRWTSDRQQLFVTALANDLNVTRAAEAVGMSRRSAYQLKQRDPVFAQAWAEALDAGYGDLEIELLRQSLHGSERTETVKDKVTGDVRQIKTVHSYPHGLALRLLLAHRGEVAAYRREQAQHEDDETVIARVRAHMDLVRERLMAADDEEGPTGEAPFPDESADCTAGDDGWAGYDDR